MHWYAIKEALSTLYSGGGPVDDASLTYAAFP